MNLERESGMEKPQKDDRRAMPEESVMEEKTARANTQVSPEKSAISDSAPMLGPSDQTAAGPYPPRPQDSSWTDDQWSAIVRDRQDILVAAAAGSGKTAVLVERIIRKICAEQTPIDVDRLLVATFTKAAAAEMRERIREALEHALDKQPESEHLRRQLALMNRASITTLHSFCMEVIQRFYQLIPLDPVFRIANETEAELMRQDVLEQLFEAKYGEAESAFGNDGTGSGSDFVRLADWFGGERNDAALFRLVQELYDFSRSHPWPDEWLKQTAADFAVADVRALEHTPWYRSIAEDVKLSLQGAAELLQQALHLAEAPGGPLPYADNLKEELAYVRSVWEAARSGGWEALFAAFQSGGFGRLKPVKGDSVDKRLQEQVKGLREQAKDTMGDVRGELFTRPPEQYLDELRELAPLMVTMTDLVIEFGESYKAAKLAKGLVDFSDLEHYCLHILRDTSSTPEHAVPSQAALEFQEQFVEILLDEYQDTNMVQEAIVTLISRQNPGNRFMVGDVKQSIYRFRLAEPGLFLQKYKAYRNDAPSTEMTASAGTSSEEGGRRIDLARNFRSRRQVVDGVNFIFKQIMDETVAEVGYDERAELAFGASYYPEEGRAERQDYAVELLLMDRGAAASGDRYIPEADDDGDESDETGGGGSDGLQEARDMETAQLEAELIAAQIRTLFGENGQEPFHVYDKKLKAMRPVMYRDIVILLRATQMWAPVMIEQLRASGIPAYAELNTGYFQATEVEIVLSLLKVVDNPYQDIPLAGVLRSPLFQITAEQLAHIRMLGKGKPFYEAVLAGAAKATEEGAAGQSETRQGASGHASDGFDALLAAKLAGFISALNRWRDEAKHGSVAALIWRLYRETGYYDLVGGLPGGIQRQANLRALYDRARQYESTSFRGLFRFLRFIERMRDSGGDLGTARALGEQEDVVRIISIHKSKGLEFPVVFVAGLAKQFNQQDLNGNFLLHKQLGFGPKFVDAGLRTTYPTLPTLAIKRRMRMETLAEEMRVLYVALTRPKEKLYLVGTVKGLDKQLDKWSQVVQHDEWHLPVFMLAKARCYLDWIGPAMIRHKAGAELRQRGEMENRTALCMADESSSWHISVMQADMFASLAAAAGEEQAEPDELQAAAIRSITELTPVEIAAASDEGGLYRDEISRRMAWQYPYAAAERRFAKTSVTELKRLKLEAEEGYGTAMLPSLAPVLDIQTGRPGLAGATSAQPFRRPKFMERRTMTATERGTLYHAVMQHVPLEPGLDEAAIASTIARMAELRILSGEQLQALDPAPVAAFFAGELGQRLILADEVKRELPFSFGIPAAEAYAGAEDRHQLDGEIVLIQGVIDCIFREGDGWVLLDFKTDAVRGNRHAETAERYRLQLDLYARAVESLWGKPVAGKYVYFFDGNTAVRL